MKYFIMLIVLLMPINAYAQDREIWRMDKGFVGRVDDNTGETYDMSGRSSGHIDSGGNIYNKDGEYSGYVDRKGDTYSSDGKYTGEIE
jgi:hypothetical protein